MASINKLQLSNFVGCDMDIFNDLVFTPLNI